MHNNILTSKFPQLLSILLDFKCVFFKLIDVIQGHEGSQTRTVVPEHGPSSYATGSAVAYSSKIV